MNPEGGFTQPEHVAFFITLIKCCVENEAEIYQRKME